MDQILSRYNKGIEVECREPPVDEPCQEVSYILCFRNQFHKLLNIDYYF